MSGPFSFGTPGTQPPVAAALTQHQLALGLSSPARSASQHQTGLANYGGGPLRPPQGQLNNTRAGISSETGALGRTVDLNEDDTPRVSNLDHGDTTDPPAADLISRDSAGLALFVDTVSNTYGFTGRDTGFRDSLHGFIKMGQGLSKPDMATRIFLLASIFQVLRELHSAVESNNAIKALLSDLQIRLDDTFALTNDQKSNIRIIAADTLYDPSRANFMHLHFEVDTKLRTEKLAMRLGNVYGNPARERLLMSVIRRICSNQRNALREMLRDSVFGDETCTLDDFVYHSANRFRRGGATLDLGATITARMGILRRFAYEHRELLDREDEDGDDEPTTPSSPNPGNPLTPSDSPASTPGSPLVNLPGGSDTGTPARKPQPKRKRPVGRTLKGQDFWSQVEKWFEQHIAAWGTRWTAEPWQQYISETITLDRDRFKPAQCESGFAMDPDVEMRNVNFLGDPSLQDPANILSMNEILNSLL